VTFQVMISRYFSNNEPDVTVHVAPYSFSRLRLACKEEKGFGYNEAFEVISDDV
jgi:hypothetical protein